MAFVSSLLACGGDPSGPDPTSTNVSPTVFISSPTNGASVEESTEISFAGSASDPEDGDLSGSIIWTSDIDGELGTGASALATLSLGTHVVTAAVTDDDGASGSDEVAMNVAPGEASQLLVRVFGGFQSIADTGGVAETPITVPDGTILSEHEVSPNGQSVAFAFRSEITDPRELHVAKLDGSPSVQISGFEGSVRNFSWSPDSRQLTFSTYSPLNVYVVNNDGTELETIVEAPFTGANPHWSPAGDWIVYAGWEVEREGSSGVWVIKPDGSQSTQITEDRVFTNEVGAIIPAPRFSPAGDQIAFESEGDLHVVRSDGTERHQLTFTPREDDWYPRWSPDGERLAYNADGGARWMIEIRDVSTGELSGSVDFDVT